MTTANHFAMGQLDLREGWKRQPSTETALPVPVGSLTAPVLAEKDRKRDAPARPEKQARNQ